MNPPRYEDLDGPPVVGQTYMANAIDYDGIFRPVHLPPHDGGDGFGSHYHYITDLMSTGLIEVLLVRRGMEHRDPKNHNPVLIGAVSGDLDKIQAMPFICYRTGGLPFPKDMTEYLEFLRNVESKVGDVKLDLKTKLCPHQGICLKRVPEVNREYQCPGHGAKFSSKDGSLIRQT